MVFNENWFLFLLIVMAVTVAGPTLVSRDASDAADDARNCFCNR